MTLIDKLAVTLADALPAPYAGPLCAGRTGDGLHVWVRSAAVDAPADRSAISNAHAQLAQIDDGSLTLAPLGFAEADGKLQLVLRDPGVVPLGLATPVEGAPEAFLNRAIALTEALQRLHELGVIHRSLRPDVIWLDPQEQVRFSGFDDATTLQGGEAGGVLPISLAHMAPEQTGRMNRGVDARADLYALGVVFFTALTGQWPLHADTPTGWIHAHLARRPALAAGPAGLARIIDLLLIKSPEDRYQSAGGLLADLRAARTAWLDSGDLGAFEPQHRSRSSRFAVPQRLFGRAVPYTALLGTLGVAADGAPRVSLVAGAPGIGKSRLIAELQPEVVRRGGFYAAGKAARYERDRPYGVLVDALSQLVDQALARPEAELQRWQAAFKGALGPNGQVVVDLVPEAGLLLGPQATVPRITPEQTRLRMRMALRAFIGVLAQPAHPVMLVLDDLQWVDDATLELVDALLEGDGLLALHLVGSYRNGEVGSGHALRRFENRLEGRAHAVETLTLGPLSTKAVEHLVAATVDVCADAREAEAVVSLAAVVVAKTAANPFFIARFLWALHDDGLLRFDATAGCWRWTLAQIAQADLADNVVALMTTRIRQLPPEAQHVLMRAAVIGSRFTLGTLAALNETTAQEALTALRPVLAAELISPLGAAAQRPNVADPLGVFRFAHDRVHEAAGGLMPEAERAALHVQIARRMIEVERITGSDTLFEIVEHFSRGAAHLTSTAERDLLAMLQCRAADRAWAAGAHRVALDRFASGVTLLDEGAWSRRYDVALALHTGLAEAARVAGETERAEAQCALVEAHARIPLDTVRVQGVRTDLLTNQMRLAEAVHGVVALVAQLGFPLVPPATPQALFQWLGKLMDQIGTRGADTLSGLPDATDPAVVATLGVIGASLPTAAMGLPEVHPVLVLHAVELTLNHGVAIGSAAAISHLGLILAATGQYDPAYMLGQLSERLRRRVVSEGTTEGLVEFALFIHPWKAPLAETIKLMHAGAQRCLELGDPMVFGYCVNQAYMAEVMVGVSLESLDASWLDRVETLQAYGQALAAGSVRIWGQVVACLRQDGVHTGLLRGSRFDAQVADAETPPILLAYMASAQALVGLLTGRPAAALQALEAQAPALQNPAVAPAFITPVTVAYHALAASAVALESDGPRRAELEATTRALLVRLRAFAGACGANHSHRVALVEAELARLEGDALGAMAAYDQAAELAQANNYRHEEAYARQRTAALYTALGRPLAGRSYAREALRLYEAWGAHGVVRILRKRWPEIEGCTGQLAAGDQLDLQAVLEASRTFAETVELEPLLERMMTIVRDNAGAQRAVFALDRAGALRVEATVDEAGTHVLQSAAIGGFAELPADLMGYVGRTHAPVVLADAQLDDRFGNSPDIRRRGVRSVLCVPLLHQGTRMGVLYLENNLAPGVFTEQRAHLVQAISAQAAIALQNAILLGEARRTAAEMAQQNARLTEVDHMREAFLARTSHELRTPINGIIGLADSLLAGAAGGLPKLIADNLQMISTSGRRLSNLVNDILDFSSLRKGTLTLRQVPVALGPVVDRVLGITRALFERKGLAVVVQVSPSLPALFVDVDRIEQVLLNLVGNAVKFTTAGRMVVDAEVHEGLIRVTVTDTGPGIAPAQQQRIFDAFDMGNQDATHGASGTGLGLSVARQLVHLHGGEIGVESVLGAGSRFWFTVPMATGVDQLVTARPMVRMDQAVAPETVEIPMVAGHHRSGDGLRILVIDDEPINLQVVVQHLSPYGFTVHTELSGTEGLARLDEPGFEPDLILLDVMMPQLDGYETCRRIRAQYAPTELPVIMLTAKNQETDLIRGLEAGANDYITKPFSARELVARMRTHLALARINRAVSRFVPQDFVQLLGQASITDVQLGDTVASRMTVLFANMHGFGTLAKSLDAHASFEFINEYLGVLEPVILRHGGFVDKYIGDQVMAIFAHEPTDAINAALDLHRAVDAYNVRRKAQGLPAISVGVGINSGDLMLGTVGSTGRMDTTVISDAVNVASRLELRTKDLAARILVGESTLTQATGHYHARLVDQLYGGDKIFEIYDAEPPGAIAAKDATREMLEDAVRAYHDRSFGLATRLFSVCKALDPADPAVRYYADRCAQVLKLLGGQEF
jgi:predicted ATPase/signal transduction histidine kinase/CheY-like chemotaxis protein